MSGTTSKGRRAASYAAVAAGGVVGLAAVSATGLAAYFTRRVVTPLVVKPDDLEILEVHADRVVLSATPDTVVPGRYGLWLDGGEGHARIGPILSQDDGSVTRELERVDQGTVRVGPARFNQYYVAGDPTTAWGIEHEDVLVPSEVGDLPTWLVRPATHDQESTGEAEPGLHDVWAVLVHGRGATREECLRGVPGAAPARAHHADPVIPQRPGRSRLTPPGATTSAAPSGGTSSRPWSGRSTRARGRSC